jgi:streptomycin 6-kinase
VRAAVDRLAADWTLTVDQPPVETFAGLVVFVHHAGRPAVLKIHGPRSDEQRSADVLSHYAGNGAVQLLERDEQGLLIERAIPGTELASLVFDGRDDQATEIVADTMIALHTRRELVDGLPTIEDRGGSLDRFKRQSDDRRLDPAMVARAASLHAELAASQTERVVLHGDLHHYNILEDSRGWLAIDPKGMIGEPAYEAGASLRNPAIILDSAILARRIEICVERLGYDRDRMIGWCFAQAILSAVWAIEDGTNADYAVACAEETLPLLKTTA